MVYTTDDKTKLVNKSLISAQSIYRSPIVTLDKPDPVSIDRTGLEPYPWQKSTGICNTTSLVDYYRHRLDSYISQRDQLKQYSDQLRQETTINPHLH